MGYWYSHVFHRFDGCDVLTYNVDFHAIHGSSSIDDIPRNRFKCVPVRSMVVNLYNLKQLVHRDFLDHDFLSILNKLKKNWG
jgi:hypothetical protein